MAHQLRRSSSSSSPSSAAVSSSPRIGSLSGDAPSGERRPLARHSSDAADREKQNYDALRRRISDFVGHDAYEESSKTSDPNTKQKSSGQNKGDKSRPDNFAQNFLKGKRQLSEGSHDRKYKWMGYASEKEMLEKTGGPSATKPALLPSRGRGVNVRRSKSFGATTAVGATRRRASSQTGDF